MTLTRRFIGYGVTVLFGGAVFIGCSASPYEGALKGTSPTEKEQQIERHYEAIENTLDIDSPTELSDDLKEYDILGTGATEHYLEMTAAVIEGDLDIEEPESNTYLPRGKLRPAHYHDEMRMLAEKYGHTVDGLDYTLITEKDAYTEMLRTFEKATSDDWQGN